jgi:hypothetical protein
MAHIPITHFAHRLATEHGIALTGNKARELVIAGVIPATLNESGTRWVVDPAALPVVAERLRQRAPQKAAA